jgi:hypothetical protein
MFSPFFGRRKPAEFQAAKIRGKKSLAPGAESCQIGFGNF